MVELEKLSLQDEKLVRQLLGNHFKYTRSPAAKEILNNFSKESRRFVKVMPREYKRVLLEKAMGEEEIELLEVSDG